MTRAPLAALLFLAAVRTTALDTPGPLEQRPAQDQTLAEARSLIDAGNPKAAIAKLETLEPKDDPRVRLLMGVAHYRADQCACRQSSDSAARRGFPGRPLERREVVQVLGLCRYLSGQLREAILPREDARVGFWQPRAPPRPRDGLHPDPTARSGARLGGADLRRARGSAHARCRRRS
jgi:hypothetical protein